MAITYNEIRRITRPWGVEVTLVFEDSGEHLRTVVFSFDSQAQAVRQLAHRIAAKITKIEIKRDILNEFNIGENSVEILTAAILRIREVPAVNFNQAEGWYNTNFPDAVFKFDKFIDKAKDMLVEKLGYVPTWDQFKTYVINNKFIWTD